jgi:hypothetical protein
MTKSTLSVLFANCSSHLCASSWVRVDETLNPTNIVSKSLKVVTEGEQRRICTGRGLVSCDLRPSRSFVFCYFVSETRHEHRMQLTLVASGPRYTTTGRVNQNVDPRPSSDVTPIPPPSSLASSRDIERPKPVPPKRRVVELSACWKGTNNDAQWLFESPIPVSLRITSQSAATTMCDDILYGKLDGNHFRVRGRSVWIHGHYALHRSLISELNRVLTRIKVRVCYAWVPNMTYPNQVHQDWET